MSSSSQDAEGAVTPLELSGGTTAPPAPIEDPLANGIKALFDPVIKQTTEKLLLVHRSQTALSAELDKLITRRLLTHTSSTYTRSHVNVHPTWVTLQSYNTTSRTQNLRQYAPLS